MTVFEQELCTILDLTESHVRKIIKENKLNTVKLRNIFRDKQAWKRRDEFYSLFKYESHADTMWERFMDNYYLDKYGIVLDKELLND